MKEINIIRKFIEKSKLDYKNYKIWKIDIDTAFTNPETLIHRLPMKVGKNCWAGIVLDEEIQISFGNKKNLTQSTLFCTTNPVEVNNGKITLIGPDLGDISNSESPLGIIVLIGGINIQPEHLFKIKSIMTITDSIEGLALKSIPRKWWYRLNKAIYQAGISFEHIGKALFYHFLKEIPELIEYIEIIFITKDNETISELMDIEKEIEPYFSNVLQKKILKYVDKYQKIREDCDLEEECEICDNQIICREIIDIIKIREKSKNANKVD